MILPQRRLTSYAKWTHIKRMFFFNFDLVFSAVLGGGTVVGGNAIKKRVITALEKKKQAERAAIVYTIRTEGKINEGLLFEAGETFNVLEMDGDAGLIDKIGDKNSPYFVSLKFLASISDYKI